MRAALVHTRARWFLAFSIPAAQALLTACSLSAPSVQDYAQQRPRSGGGAGGDFSNAGTSGALAGTAGDDSVPSGGTIGEGAAGSSGTAGSNNAGTSGVAGAGGSGAAGTSSVAGTSGVSGTAGAGGASSGGAGGTGGAPSTGSAISFLASQVVRVGKAPTGDLTIELWLNTKMFGPGDEWFEGAALFDCDYSQGNASDFGATLVGTHFAFGTGSPDGDVTVLSTSDVNTGVWVHLAATRKMSNGVVAIYVNGQPETSKATGNTGRLTQATAPAIGAWVGDDAVSGIANGLAGQITELRVWNTVRTAAQIAANMHTSLRGNENGLVGYWRFDDGSGLVAKDSSPSGNDGVLGAGNSQFVPDWVMFTPSLVQ